MNDYYDLNSNRIFVRGFKDLKTIHSTDDEVIFKYVNFSSVTKKIYLINQYGTVINSITNIIQQPIVDNGFPCVALSSIEYVNDKQCFSVIRYRIVDLVAYSFIRNSDVYLERGCIALNKNGILTDNYYTNIEYQQ